MKTKLLKRKNEYIQLKLQLVIRCTLAGFGAILILLLIYNLIWYQRGSTFLVEMFQRFLGVSYYEALDMYQRMIRNNTDIIWSATVLLIFALLLTLVLNWFVRYFDQINQGIRALLDDSTEIHLPDEMAETERILLNVKSELKQRKTDAQLAEQRKNDLVMYLAHDIRTPLTSVIGYLSLLDEVPDMPAKQKAKYIRISLDKTYRLEHMIHEFFEITRYNLQQISIEKEPVDLSYMLIQLTDELTPLLLANGNTTVIDAPENLCIHADSDKLARVCINVLKNAAAYSYPGTEIRICAREQENTVLLTFQNHGRHIPKEKLDSLFEKFFRLDESRTSHTGGAGLGLAIAKEIITLHGGTISADSNNGLITFTICLPA